MSPCRHFVWDILYFVFLMTVNMITVFRNGRFLAANEVCLYGDEEIEDVNSYKSLELYFTTKVSFIQAVGKDQNQSDTQISMETRKRTDKCCCCFSLMYDASWHVLACPCVYKPE